MTWKKTFDQTNVVPLSEIPKGESQLEFAMVSGCMTNGNINRFVKAHRDADRFKLVAHSHDSLLSSVLTGTLTISIAWDAARGLVYMHALGMVHGDLKGCVSESCTCNPSLNGIHLLG